MRTISSTLPRWSSAERDAPGLVAGVLAIAGCAASIPGSGGGGTTKDTVPETTSLGEPHAGDYSLGPVAFSGSFWNSCAPYTPELEREAGPMLAGLALKWNGGGDLCDACILVKTGRGKSVVARVVTTGETRGPNDIDLSQAAFDAIHSGEYPRSMTWELVKCPTGGKVQYQFQTEANPYWTSLWVRNARVPVASVEVKKAGAATRVRLTRGTDGTLTDASGFGEGPFELRVTAIDGQVITDDLPRIVPGGVVPSRAQFE